MTQDPSRGSLILRAKSINKENVRIYNENEDMHLQIFRLFRINETVPERVCIAIISQENITFLPLAAPSFLFYPYGRPTRRDSNLARLRIGAAKSAIEFLGLPLEEKIGELDFSGKIKSM